MKNSFWGWWSTHLIYLIDFSHDKNYLFFIRQWDSLSLTIQPMERKIRTECKREREEDRKGKMFKACALCIKCCAFVHMFIKCSHHWSPCEWMELCIQCNWMFTWTLKVSKNMNTKTKKKKNTKYVMTNVTLKNFAKISHSYTCTFNSDERLKFKKEPIADNNIICLSVNRKQKRKKKFLPIFMFTQKNHVFFFISFFFARKSIRKVIWCWFFCFKF